MLKLLKTRCTPYKTSNEYCEGTMNQGNKETEEMEVDADAVSLPSFTVNIKSEEEQQRLVGTTFQTHHVSATQLDKLGNHFSPDGTSSVIDLRAVIGAGLFLEKGETFLPTTRLYIRDCMKQMLQKFHEDKIKLNSNRVLLGSPGVGKSVLFFIAALIHAWLNKRPVVYYRQTRAEKYASAFVMFAKADGLAVFAARNIDREEFHERIHFGVRTVADCFGLGKIENYVSFLDGPRHDHGKSSLFACYHYFCTSGGHPIPKNEQKDLFLWILDAWTIDEVKSLCTSLYPGDAEKLEAGVAAYKLFGGCIRDIHRLLSSGEDANKDKKL